MKKLFFLLVLLYITQTRVFTQPVLYQWDYRYGGIGDEWLYEFKPTMDAGYILAGFSYSGISGDKSQASWGDRDYWLVKTNSMGILEWEQRYGGSSSDILHCTYHTADGGFIAGGMSNSPVSGNKTEGLMGSFDYWIVKTDALGNIEWDKRYGGTSSDDLRSIYQTNDGGYLLAGRSLSGIGGHKTEANYGTGDWWIIKIDATGTLEWEKSYGGSGDEYFVGVVQTTDGGYLLTGDSNSGISGDKTMVSKGFTDYWIIKTDASGNVLWDKSYGGNSIDILYNMIPTSDNGFMLAGISWSSATGDKTQPCWGMNDYWLVKIDAVGNLEWEKDFGGIDIEETMGNVIQTLDGGYLVNGVTYSDISGNKTELNLGYRQQWAVKTDAAGNLLWEKTIFTNDQDFNGFVAETDSGCYTFASFTPAGIGGYKTQPSWGSNDYWMVKFCSEPVLLPVELISFHGIHSDEKNHLFWFTASELNSANFEIQKSKAGDPFKTIGQINAAGYSNQLLSYTFSDPHPDIGNNYYRLKQNDINGTYTYSSTIVITTNENTLPEFIISPNPVKNYFEIQLPGLEQYIINISNSKGNLVHRELNYTSGKVIDISLFPEGFYFINISNARYNFNGTIVKN